MATSERRKVIRPKAKSETDPLKTRPAARIRKKNNKDQIRRDVLVMWKRKATYRISQHCQSKKNTLDAAKRETGSGLYVGDSDSKSKGTRPITCFEKAGNVGGVPVTITLARHELLFSEESVRRNETIEKYICAHGDEKTYPMAEGKVHVES